MRVSIIAIFLCTGIIKMTCQTAIKPTVGSAISYINGKSNLEMNNSVCECINYDCGCCEFIHWDVLSLNGTLCTNASYLVQDIGISVTVTFNDFAIINETVSARNPPPICVGEDILDSLKIEFCLRICDIKFKSDRFHACFEIFGKFMNIKTPRIRLGCVDTLQKTVKYTEDKIFPYLSQALYKKKTKDSILPRVIMV